jgi:hypothetical protein
MQNRIIFIISNKNFELFLYYVSHDLDTLSVLEMRKMFDHYLKSISYDDQIRPRSFTSTLLPVKCG